MSGTRPFFSCAAVPISVNQRNSDIPSTKSGTASEWPTVQPEAHQLSDLTVTPDLI
jgi:hypothetical protein